MPVNPAFSRLLRRIASGLDALLAARSGNVIAIMAGALPVLLVLISGGVDLSRAYLARTSLQSACDAGVLAGRRAMSKSGSFSTAEQAAATRMFNFNFAGNTVAAADTSFAMQSTSAGEVTGTASTRVPVTLSKMFGRPDFALTVNCSAELQLASADVMFVLDTTGSMACAPDGTNCISGTDSKIAGLRDAVRDFYKTVAAAVIDKNSTRIRFGFVPYSMTVNVKKLLLDGDIPSSYIADTNTYQTKLAYFGTPVSTGTAGAPVTTTETYSSAIKSQDCDKYAINQFPSGGGSNPVSGGGPAPTATTSTQYSLKSWTQTSGNGSNAVGTCVRNKSVTTTTYSTSQYRFSYYQYQRAALSTASFKGFGTVTMATAVNSNTTLPAPGTYDMLTLPGVSGISGLTTAASTWGGCIEERSTVVDSAMNPVPSGATDLDINAAPTSDATRWKPYWGDVEVYRSNYYSGVNSTTNLGGSTEYCPTEIKKFTEVDTTAPNTVPTWLDSYLNSLVARGGTYHDIGMIWGGRMASPHGIMASNVNVGTYAPSRHIIFLTDGIMEPSLGAYSAYGMEYYDNRVAPSGSSQTVQTDYHNARFLAACNAAKAEGYTIWVIGFGVALTSQMQACASGGRAYASSDTAALKTTFRYIAGEVAELRINR